MLKTRLAVTVMAAAIVLMSACSSKKLPGSWLPVDTGTGDAFYSVNFVNDEVGWLNSHADRNYVSPSDNQNANQNGNVNANRNAAAKKPAKKVEDPLKANQGFEVLQTTDGGQTWRQIPDQFKYKIRLVWFVDPSQGWALTIDRDILHTADGGANWSLQRKAGTVRLKLFGNRREPELDQPEQLESLYFLDNSHGWAWGGGRKDDYSEQPGIFLTTVDGGEHWNEVPYPFGQKVWGIFFLDTLRAWASSEDGGFYRTIDGGLNWSRIQGRQPEDVFYSIFFLDDNNGWIAGRSGRLARTSDGGRTWKRMVYIRSEFKLKDLFFFDPNHGWAVGEQGAILYTPDGGESWIQADSPATSSLVDVAFRDRSRGWVVGLGGVALKFEQAGK
jgi:photosystem II stability/assembly factor-like uncharacterized protein